MHFIVTESIDIFFKENVILIPVPSAVLHLPAQEYTRPPDPVSLVPGASSSALISSLRVSGITSSESMIIIQEWDARGMVQFLCAAAEKYSWDKRRSAYFFGQINRPVGTERIDYNQFIYPTYTLQALFNLILTVETGDNGANSSPLKIVLWKILLLYYPLI